MADNAEQKKGIPKGSIQMAGKNLLKIAIGHHLSGDLLNAEKAYRAAIKIGYLHSALFSNLGVICKDSERMEEAIYLYMKAIEVRPNDPNAYANLGILRKELGQLDQALAAILKFLELKPDNPTAHMNLGSIYRDLGQLDQAHAATLKSIELKPDNPIAYMNLGGVYKGLGQLDQALVATLKSLELKADNPSAHMNLGQIYKDLGQLDQALAATLKSIELKPDNPTAHMNLGGIYQDLGQLDQALVCLKEAMKSEEIKKKSATVLARTYYLMGNYHEGIKALSGINTKESDNLRLSLYLCLDKKREFNKCADGLISKRWLDSQGTAAIDHANVLYNQLLDNGLGGRSTIDSIFVRNINKQEFSDALIQEILNRLSDGSLQSRGQKLLVNGSQTSGNILEIPEKPFQILKELFIHKINEYNQAFGISVVNDFNLGLKKNMYILRGWAIVMDKGGGLKSHNHEQGWLTGTFYLQMPEEGINPEEGAIEFSQQGPKYPEGTSVFKKRIMRPAARDLNIFPSSLFHRTLPFQSKTQRVCIAFDVTKNEQLRERSD